MTEPTEEFLEMLAKSASHQLAIDRIEELEEAVRELTNRIERLEGSDETHQDHIPFEKALRDATVWRIGPVPKTGMYKIRYEGDEARVFYHQGDTPSNTSLSDDSKIIFEWSGPLESKISVEREKMERLGRRKVMKCPYCGYESLNQINDVNRCRSCGDFWTLKQQSEIEALKKQLALCRKTLWLFHPDPLGIKYGDDGEMQLNGHDFLREPIEDLINITRKAIQKELSTLQERLREADIIIKGFIAIVNDSRGVDGYHLNGNIAEWGEFEEPALAEEYIQKYAAKKLKGANHA